ncbi:MAG: hypothetical protein KDH16_18910 [Rhodocyclaceae bacterium]|nr:hypothetical protein [Rhodocyclaceae bacterium]
MPPLDPFGAEIQSPFAAFTDWMDITPNDDEDLPVRPRVIFAGGAGTVKVVSASGNVGTVTMAAGDGKILRPVRILATGTDATGIMIAW